MALSRRTLLAGHSRPQPEGMPLPWWRHQPGCDACGKCVAACETGIVVSGAAAPQVDFTRGECTFCGACAASCPQPLFHDITTSPWHLRLALSSACVTFQGVNCRSCQESCEHQAIRFRFNALGVAQPEIQPENCKGCGACIAPCPVSATGLHHA